MGNLFWAGVWHIAHHQVGYTTKKIQSNFFVEDLPQLFSLQNTMHVSICFKDK